MSNYSDLLKHPNWQKKRLLILERDNWTCQSCGDKESMLHVHHFRYLPNNKPWEYSDEFLITLCQYCHKEEEEFIKSVNAKFVALSRNAFFPIGKMYRVAHMMATLHFVKPSEYLRLNSLLNQFFEENEETLDVLPFENG